MEKKIVVKKEVVLLILLIALFVPGMQGCKDAGAKAVKKADPVRPVKAIQLESALQETVRTFPGSAKAVKEVNLAFRVGGPLVALNGDTGDKVTRGEVIARIDPRDFRVQAKALGAKLAASRAQLNEAKLQYERYKNLIRENAAAKATFDRVKASYEMASAQVDADLKNLEAARNALEDTVLKAPFTGFIHEKLVENHETVAQGQPIFSIVDLSRIEVEIGIPEDLLDQVSGFSDFTCRFEAYLEKEFKAEFKEVGKKPNASNRTYPLTLILHSEDRALVRPGMAAEVAISISAEEKEGRFIIPAESLVNDSSRNTYVWVFNDDRGVVEKRVVSTGGYSSGGVEVKGALHSGEWVVTAGAHFLEDGQKVRLLKPASETNVGNML